MKYLQLCISVKPAAFNIVLVWWNKASVWLSGAELLWSTSPPARSKPAEVIIYQSTITQRPPRPNVGPEEHTHMFHACSPIMPVMASYLSQGVLSLSDKLNMWIREEFQGRGNDYNKAINCVSVEVRDTYPLLLSGYKSLEAGGHAEAELVDKRGLRLAVDLHPHAGLESCILWKVRWKNPVSRHTPRNVGKRKIRRLNVFCFFIFVSVSDRLLSLLLDERKKAVYTWQMLLQWDKNIFSLKQPEFGAFNSKPFKIVFIITHTAGDLLCHLSWHQTQVV